MAKIVNITYDPETGEIEADLIGFHGQGCDAVIEMFNELGQVTTEKKKPEYKEKAIKVNRATK
jgi:hypothetical protein